MSAAEIIELIEKLPPNEREKVKLHLAAGPSGDGVRRAGLTEGKAVGQEFIDRHPELFRRLAE